MIDVTFGREKYFVLVLFNIAIKKYSKKFFLLFSETDENILTNNNLNDNETLNCNE